jgi:hypothetical protein
MQVDTVPYMEGKILQILIFSCPLLKKKTFGVRTLPHLVLVQNTSVRFRSFLIRIGYGIKPISDLDADKVI